MLGWATVGLVAFTAGCASDDDSLSTSTVAAFTVAVPASTPPAGSPSAAAATTSTSATSATSVTSVTTSASAPTSAVPAVGANGITVVVKALDNRFVAPDITVVAGTRVEWDNRGRNDHDVIPVGGTGASWGVTLADFGPGATYSRVFGEAGTYVYVCTIHGKIVNGVAKGMVGVVTVTG